MRRKPRYASKRGQRAALRRDLEALPLADLVALAVEGIEHAHAARAAGQFFAHFDTATGLMHGEAMTALDMVGRDLQVALVEHLARALDGDDGALYRARRLWRALPAELRAWFVSWNAAEVEGFEDAGRAFDLEPSDFFERSREITAHTNH
jgi:hypothetical protein